MGRHVRSSRDGRGLERTVTPTCDVESWADAWHVAAWRATKEETTMFDRFTDRARKALGEARSIAIETGSNVMTPEHLFVGLLRDRDALAARSLAVRCLGGFDLAWAQDKALELIKQRTGGAADPSQVRHGVQIPHSQSMRRCFELASAAASRLRNGYIGTEHLLLGIVENHDYVPINAVLEGIGLTKSGIVQAVMTELGAQAAPETAPPAATFAAGTVSSTDAESSVQVDVTRTQTAQPDSRRLDSTYSEDRSDDHECAFVDQIAKGVADAVIESFEKIMEQALTSTINQVKADFVAALDEAKSVIEAATISFNRKG